jgi:hypothetical protein
MKIHSLFLSNSLRWNIGPSDPITWPAIAEVNASVLNPIAHFDDDQLLSVFPLIDGRQHVITNRVNILAEEDIGDHLFDLIQPWLRRLRIASKQASLPTEAHGFSIKDFSLSDANIWTQISSGRMTIFGEFHINTALDDAAIRLANELGIEATIPIHHDLLLDALHACEIQRSRDAILFSAIAIESLAQYELNKNYEAAVLAEPPPSHLNILEFQQPGGKTVKKDPVFSLLTESENFGKLLHEAPLYLMRRSLLKEFPTLYAKARALYGTRNRLSHGQTVEPNNEKLLQIDQEGAISAAATAVAVFDWFGQSGYYVPDRKMIDAFSP